MKMQAQAERFGATIVFDDVVDLSLDSAVKTVTLGNGDVLYTLHYNQFN